MTRNAAQAVALAAVLVLAGCGEKRHTGSSGGTPTASISETEYRLSPAAASVSPGSAITVKNDGAVTHALEIVIPSGEIRTRTLSPGQSVDVKAPDKAGSYDMYCPIDRHRQKGMAGKLKVTGGGGASPSSNGPGGY